jgi:hypothetical protein
MSLPSQGAGPGRPPAIIAATRPAAKKPARRFGAVTIETLFPAARHRADTGLAQTAAIAAAVRGIVMEDLMTTSTNRKRTRLRLVLAIAAALGCSSATMSGVFGALSLQQPAGGTRVA